MKYHPGASSVISIFAGLPALLRIGYWEPGNPLAQPFQLVSLLHSQALRSETIHFLAFQSLPGGMQVATSLLYSKLLCFVLWIIFQLRRILFKVRIFICCRQRKLDIHTGELNDIFRLEHFIDDPFALFAIDLNGH